MVEMKLDKEIVLPSWLGSGYDLFDTIQIIKGKNIQDGYLEIDLRFKFGDNFEYPIVFEIKSSVSGVDVVAIAFNISETDKTKWLIEEKVIVPKICNIITREDFINYFTDVVERNIDFALYINKKPWRYAKLKFYNLKDTQKIIFNEHFVMAITKVLDERRARR